MLVRLGERGVLARSPHRLARLVRRGVGRPRVAEPSVADHADAQASRLREGHALDLAAEGAHLRLPPFLCVGLDLLVLVRGLDRGMDERSELRHRSLRP